MHQPDRSVNAALKNPLPSQVGGSYRWFTGSLAYVLHRVTGLGLVFFIFFHILSVTKATSADPSHYDLMIRRMQEPDFKLGEIALYAALLFHGLNGMRILLIDFVLVNTHRNKMLFWACCWITVILLIAGTIPLLLHSNVQPFFTDTLPGGGN
ncbi:MAG: succinate dehydrogenase, cytochrome b556 subunit [Planctomycetota bacterium]|nr:MAG: succinate dehydrogenase, cytochrome b556 subunit [Planctomycetota bacterium]